MSRGKEDRAKTGAPEWDRLTPIETQIVQLVTEGLTNRQIGDQMSISRHTVDTHLRKIFDKLGVRSRVALASKSIQATALCNSTRSREGKRSNTTNSRDEE